MTQGQGHLFSCSGQLEKHNENSNLVIDWNICGQKVVLVVSEFDTVTIQIFFLLVQILSDTLLPKLGLRCV